MIIIQKLRPFGTPNFAVAEAPGTQSFPLSDLSPEALAAMCDQFRKDVFEKAGKPDPEKK